MIRKTLLILVLFVCSYSYGQTTKQDSLNSNTAPVASQKHEIGNRAIISKKNMINRCNAIGVVKIQLVINPEGDVISAESVEGSSDNKCLIHTALQLVKSFKYEPSTSAPPEEQNIITIDFGL